MAEKLTNVRLPQELVEGARAYGLKQDPRIFVYEVAAEALRDFLKRSRLAEVRGRKGQGKGEPKKRASK